MHATLHTTIQTIRPTTSHEGTDERLTDEEAALIIRAGFAFDALFILIGLIAVVAGRVAGGVAVVGLGLAALFAGWVVVALSDHFRH
jgi:hypothetical protein